jgi:hypothetical protein
MEQIQGEYRFLTQFLVEYYNRALQERLATRRGGSGGSIADILFRHLKNLAAHSRSSVYIRNLRILTSFSYPA